LAALCAARLAADVIETADGARIVGKIKLIHGGVILLSTTYAGDIKINQSLVTSITTDRPVAVKVADSTRVIGTVTSAAGDITVTGRRGIYTAPIGKVSVLWAAADEDPDVVAARRKWSFEAGADVVGESGTHNSLGTSYDFLATLTGPADVLKYYTDYTRQETDSQVSSDQFKAGADYEANFTPLESWYVKDEGGFDSVNSIAFYDIGAGGLGYDFIKREDETFTGRVGISYRYDRYSADGVPNLSQAGADFGLEYSRKFKTSLLSDTISFDPTFENPGVFVASHQFKYDIPLANPYWKLSTGMTNNYNSRPVPGVVKLDTLYFMRLVLTWGVKGAQ
jgi:hypothetical protein